MTRRRIQAREPFTVPNPATFQHTDADCPCKPRAIVVNPSGLNIPALMHYPATGRGRLKRSSLMPKRRKA